MAMMVMRYGVTPWPAMVADLQELDLKLKGRGQSCLEAEAGVEDQLRQLALKGTAMCCSRSGWAGEAVRSRGLRLG